ncbi:peptidylprolyl isomerase [Methylacidimicrobium sp. B4]|uniref:peptidylprolyl isomerase n=1 Tax=Methylacidimicrobium sp. B4 TaxID=2796139 RepID=UPI001F5C8F65|nr:peptidylprolyl isomerase [Methylacidimicrobium sp. B4]
MISYSSMLRMPQSRFWAGRLGLRPRSLSIGREPRMVSRSASFAGLLLVLAAIPCRLFAQAGVDGVAAIVNDKVITFSEVKKQVEPNEAVLRETYQGPELVDRVKDARLNALRALIERELIIQDFKKKGYQIPDTFIETRVRDMIRSQFDGDRIAFIRTLQASGMTEERYKQNLLDQIVVQAMRMKNVSDSIVISPYQVEQYYHDHLAVFVEPPSVKLRLIFLQRSALKERRVGPDGQEEEYDQPLETAKDLETKLRFGANFGDLARSYSEGPRKQEGGDLGWVTRDTLRPEIADAAFAMFPGQTSDVISTPDGYYLLHLEDKRRERVKPISSVRTQIETALLQEKRQKRQQEWLDSLRVKAFIKMF